MIDDLESPAAFPAWYPWNVTKLTREGPGHGGAFALHAIGTAVAAVGSAPELVVASLPNRCTDYVDSQGFSFWAKAAAPTQIRVGVAIAATLPTTTIGGTCTAGCVTHTKDVTFTTTWTQFTFAWTDFAQIGAPNPIALDKNTIRQFTFTNVLAGSYDYWLDDLYIATVNRGTPTCTAMKYLNATTFNAWFPGRLAFYQYADLCTAITRYWNFTWSFANSGNADIDKREIAAFFGQADVETAHLTQVNEVAQTDAPWFGRGPLQLTHMANYRDAGFAMMVDLITGTNYNLVSTDPVISWGASLWFWMISNGAGTTSCHAAMVSGLPFGETTRIINGAVEDCHLNTGVPGQRITAYTNFCASLGVAPGPTLCN